MGKNEKTENRFMMSEQVGGWSGGKRVEGVGREDSKGLTAQLPGF